MFIVIGNGHGDSSSNPGRDWMHFTYGKRKNQLFNDFCILVIKELFFLHFFFKILWIGFAFCKTSAYLECMKDGIFSKFSKYDNCSNVCICVQTLFLCQHPIWWDSPGNSGDFFFFNGCFHAIDVDLDKIKATSSCISMGKGIGVSHIRVLYDSDFRNNNFDFCINKVTFCPGQKNQFYFPIYQDITIKTFFMR